MPASLRREGWALAAAAVCGLLMLAAWAASPSSDPAAAGGAPAPDAELERVAAAAVRHGEPPQALEPEVAVRLTAFEGHNAVRFGLDGAWRILDEHGEPRADGFGLEGLIRADPTGVQVGPYLCGVDRLLIAPAGDSALRVGDERYPGALEVGLLREGARATGLSLVLHLALEDYVLGVVCGEMPTTSPGIGPALRAQAVAARTYALWRLGDRRGALRDTAGDQVFRGLDWHTQAAREAVAETRGLVLTWKDSLLPAYFHAECGGATADAHALGFVPRALPPLAGAPDPGCEQARPWSATVPAERLDAAARALRVGDWLRSVHALESDGSGRMLRARLLGNDSHFDGPSEEARARFGVPSAAWTRARVRPDGALELQGRGRGHGIGLCQEGARRRARAGQDWREILHHYYPGAGLQPLTAELLDA